MRASGDRITMIVRASAITMAFNYAQRPSYAAPNHGKPLDANRSEIKNKGRIKFQSVTATCASTGADGTQTREQILETRQQPLLWQ
jgi:hypothetical protein